MLLFPAGVAIPSAVMICVSGSAVLDILQCRCVLDCFRGGLWFIHCFRTVFQRIDRYCSFIRLLSPIDLGNDSLLQVVMLGYQLPTVLCVQTEK